MSRTTVGRTVGCVVLLLGLTGYAAGGPEGTSPPPQRGKEQAQSPKESSSAGVKGQRFLYIVRHGSAKDLAVSLGKLFQGDAEIEALPTSLGNCLLIRAAPPASEEVVKLLEQLDHSPRAVAVEVFIAEVAPRKGEG